MANLPARVSIVAASNPITGHYNMNMSVSENIKMNPALLSRFDLIFLMIDSKGTIFDQKLSEHIMNKKAKGKQ
ncbi:MAG: DNA replication licensing factor mcm8 [Paramarteilia canceri]